MGIRRRHSFANEVKAPRESTLGGVDERRSTLDRQLQDFLPEPQEGWAGRDRRGSGENACPGARG